jgi:hypothetical protein
MGLWTWADNDQCQNLHRLQNKQKELYEATAKLQRIEHGINRKKILRMAGDIDSKITTFF